MKDFVDFCVNTRRIIISSCSVGIARSGASAQALNLCSADPMSLGRAGAAAATVLAAACGYAMAKFAFRGRELIFSVILGGILVLSTALAIPLYLLIAKIHLVGSYWSVQDAAPRYGRGAPATPRPPRVPDLRAAQAPPGHRHPVRGSDQVQLQAPVPARMRGAIRVPGLADQLGASDRFPGRAAWQPGSRRSAGPGPATFKLAAQPGPRHAGSLASITTAAAGQHALRRTQGVDAHPSSTARPSEAA